MGHERLMERIGCTSLLWFDIMSELAVQRHCDYYIQVSPISCMLSNNKVE